MTQRHFILVPGILTFPGASKNWYRRAVTFINAHTNDKAEAVEYFATPGTRSLFQNRSARKFAEVMSEAQLALLTNKSRTISVVAHSNGCDVALDGLRLLGWPPIDRLILVGAACSHDLEKLGVVYALARRKIRKVELWLDEKDKLLWWASTPVGRGLGFGALGRTGPQRPHPNVHEWWSDLGHSDWFNERNIYDSLNRIIKETVTAGE